MEKMNDYEKTEAFTGEFEKIALGGHVCEIKGAKIEQSKNGREMLAIAFDIAEGENKGFYQRRFDEVAKNDTSAKWPGVYRLLTKDTEGNCNKFFKGFITSVENSNKGYKWDWNEESLKGKKFGGVFGREQYRGNDDKLKFATKIRYVRAIDKVKEADVPEDKLLNETNSGATWEPVDTNELPF